MRIGTLCYFLYFQKLPFSLYESILPWYAMNGIDMGEINHSREFARKFVSSVYDVLVKRLRVLLSKPLPCTGDVSPIVILGDKGTVKRDVTQPTIIRVAFPGEQNLFRKYYLSHPLVTSHSGDNVTELLIQSIKETLNWSIPEIRERFCGGAFDGQYLKLNVPTHLAEKLSLKPDFTEDSTIWDAAHRVELACEDTKKGTKWLTDFDTTLQSIMKKFTLGMHHTDVRDIAKELGETFLEFCLFSDTRFIEYAHRTYDHFYLMYKVLTTKVRRDIEKDPGGENDRGHTETQMAQLYFVLDLIFMREISHLMTMFSTSVQTFDVLPFHSMNQFEKLKENLSVAMEKFKLSQFPDTITLESRGNKKKYSLWSDFSKCIEMIRSDQSFYGFLLLLPNDRGRVLRSSVTDLVGFDAHIKSRFSMYGKYLEHLLFFLHSRFLPWPGWVVE